MRKEDIKRNNCDNDTFSATLLYGRGVYVRLKCLRCKEYQPEYGGG